MSASSRPAAAALARARSGLGLLPLLLASALPLPSAAQGTGAAAQEWGVVLGADRTLPLAAREVSVNTSILGQPPRVYLCNGWYRTIATYASKREALQGLKKVLDAGSKRSPYIISISQWCPSKKLLPPR